MGKLEFVGFHLEFSVKFFRPCKHWEGRRVILALRTLDVVHVSPDDLNVVWLVGFLLNGIDVFRPVELEHDEERLILVQEMIDHTGEETARITEVKGHADEEMVRAGQTQEQDRVGNDMTCKDTDFASASRTRVIDAPRNFSGVCVPLFWRCIIFTCHLSCCSEK